MGTDSFSYIASDSMSQWRSTTVTINVAARAATTRTDSYSDYLTQTLNVTAANGVLANDADQNSLALSAQLAGGVPVLFHDACSQSFCVQVNAANVFCCNRIKH